MSCFFKRKGKLAQYMSYEEDKKASLKVGDNV